MAPALLQSRQKDPEMFGHLTWRKPRTTGPRYPEASFPDCATVRIGNISVAD